MFLLERLTVPSLEVRQHLGIVIPTEAALPANVHPWPEIEGFERPGWTGGPEWDRLDFDAWRTASTVWWLAFERRFLPLIVLFQRDGHPDGPGPGTVEIPDRMEPLISRVKAIASLSACENRDAIRIELHRLEEEALGTGDHFALARLFGLIETGRTVLSFLVTQAAATICWVDRLIARLPRFLLAAGGKSALFAPLD